jgi:transglutaminase-like putative cysteine protease
MGSTGSQTGTPTHFLIYDVETRDYRGTASDGTLVVVDEHVFAERVRALAHQLAAASDGMYADAAAYRRVHNTAIYTLSNADAWREQHRN